MDKGGDSGGIELTRQQCGCVIVTSGPQDARRTAKQPCETHKSRSRRDAPGGWAHDGACESEFVTEAGRWSPCRCGERVESLRQNAAILSASTLDEALKLELVTPYREKIAELEDMVFQLRMEVNRLRGLA